MKLCVPRGHNRGLGALWGAGVAWAAAFALATCGCAPAPLDDDASTNQSVTQREQALGADSIWAATGAMSVARQAATATTLPNGAVLIVGGKRIGSIDVGDVVFETAELFNPKTDSFALVPGKMAQKRLQHAAALIAGGKVLVAGGLGTATSLKTAEIFDSKSFTWTSTPDLIHEHWGATLTVLPDGRVLLAGGAPIAEGGAAEVYDPALNTWTDVAPMSVPRRHHTATLLPTGRVLVAGGEIVDGESQITASAEVFDPAAGAWSPTGPMSIERASHAAALLDNGIVVVVGGLSSKSTIVASAERFSAAQGTWKLIPEMAFARRNHTATPQAGGALLVTGGLDATSSTLRSAELFDSASNQWVSSGLLSHGRVDHVAALLASGGVLVAGGEFQSSAEVYMPAALGQPCEVGSQCDSGRCVDGVCCNKDCAGMCSTCALPGALGICSPAAAGTDPHHDCGGGGLCDNVCDATGACVDRIGEVCIAPACAADGLHALEAATCTEVGGACTPTLVSCTPYRCGESGSPATLGCMTTCKSIDDCADGYACDTEGKCRARPDVAATFVDGCSMGPPRGGGAGLACVALVMAALLRRRRRGIRSSAIVGAAAALGSWITSAPQARADEAKVNPIENIVSSEAASSMSTVRWLHVSARLADGRVLVAGGNPNGSASTTAEVYDPKSGTWTLTGPMLYNHDWPLGSPLCDGRVFVAGRYDGFVGEAEIYDPATNAWTSAGKMKKGHLFGTATLLPDCRLLLVGGYSANTQAEIYNPMTGVYKGAGVMNSERFFHTATLLNDGRVLVAGGGVDAGGAQFWVTYATADIFDPATGAWTKAKNMHHKRRAHTATLLPNGQVLVTGGTEGGKADGTEAGIQLASAEVYDPELNTWTELPSPLITARTFHTAALLPGGAVVLFGGLDASGSASRDVEGYMDGQWQALAPMLTDRFWHTSTALDDGRLLLAGGPHQATAEMYGLAPRGEACASNIECGSGHCSNGVCCDEACTTGCRRCDAEGKKGTCSRTCADGARALVCPDASAACSNDACVPMACGELRCGEEAGECLQKCASVADCAPGYACDLAGACVTPPDVSSNEAGSCRASTPGERGGPEMGALAAALAMALARRRGRLSTTITRKSIPSSRL